MVPIENVLVAWLTVLLVTSGLVKLIDEGVKVHSYRGGTLPQSHTRTQEENCSESVRQFVLLHSGTLSLAQSATHVARSIRSHPPMPALLLL